MTGDLFESPAQTIVNTVNTIGVMGKGLALRYKRTFPDMFEEYSDRCERGELDIGTLFLWRTSNKVVLNFPTKTTWRKPSQVDYIRRGLETFRANYPTQTAAPSLIFVRDLKPPRTQEVNHGDSLVGARRSNR